MNISIKTKHRIALAFATSVILVSAWSWLRDDSLPMRRVETGGTAQGNSAEHLPAASHLRVRKPAGEFFASQKEKHIQRLLANILATLPEKDQLLRSDYFVRQVEMLVDEDVPLVLQRLDDDLRHSEFGTLLVRRWTESSSQAAAEWVRQLSAGEGRDGLMTQVAMVWSNLDLNSANSWAQSLTEEGDQTKVKLIMVEEAIRQDPVSALEMANGLPPGTGREQLVIRALNEWAAREPVAALQSVASITEPAWQQQLRASLIPTIASIDGSSGARLATTWLTAGPEQELAAVAVVQRWAQESPEAAAEWVDRFPAGSMRLAAVDNLTRIWKLRDASAVDTLDAR
ncbi:MAG: hypothetical protein ACO1QS_20620 [Verrucomicrobiota bacterium]